MKRNSNRLRSIEIRGYKSIPFKCPLRLEFGDINILLGPNGAGKSNIVSFFRLIEVMMKGGLQRYVAESGTNQRFLYYGAKKTPSMQATLSFEGLSFGAAYSFALSRAVPDRLIMESEEIEWSQDSDAQASKSLLQSDFKESALVRATDNKCKEVRKWLKGCKVYQFSDSSASSPMREAAEADSAHYLHSDGSNLAAFLYYLRDSHPQSFSRILRYVGDVVPQFNDFYLEPERGYISLKWTDTSPNDYVLSADQLSDGSIRFIALATLLLQPADTMPFVIIIDEPELGLHPYAIEQLNEMIRDASRHAQIVVATQSTSILDGFSADDVTIIERDDAIQGTTARRLAEADYSDWLEEYALSELWNKNIIGGRPV